MLCPKEMDACAVIVYRCVFIRKVLHVSVFYIGMCCVFVVKRVCVRLRYIYIYIYIVHFVVEAVCVHVWQICGPILDVHMLLVFDKKCECDLC
jgi:hypothetical protein